MVVTLNDVGLSMVVVMVLVGGGGWVFLFHFTSNVQQIILEFYDVSQDVVELCLFGRWD